MSLRPDLSLLWSLRFASQAFLSISKARGYRGFTRRHTDLSNGYSRCLTTQTAIPFPSPPLKH